MLDQCNATWILRGRSKAVGISIRYVDHTSIMLAQFDSENKHGLIQSLQFTVGVVLAESYDQDTKTAKTFPLFAA